jgi:hypothetical protein
VGKEAEERAKREVLATTKIWLDTVTSGESACVCVWLCVFWCVFWCVCVFWGVVVCVLVCVLVCVWVCVGVTGTN